MKQDDMDALLQQESKSLRGLVRKLMRRFNVPMGELEDLVQDASMVAIEQAEEYDPEKSSLTTYLQKWILNCVIKAKNSSGKMLVSDAESRKLRKILQAVSELEEISGANPTHEQIAKRCGLSVDEVASLMRLGICSLDQPVGHESDEVKLGDTVQDLGEEDLDEPVPEDAMQVLEKWLRAIPDPLERRLFTLRYGRLITRSDPYTMEHAARVLGILHVDDAWLMENLLLTRLEKQGMFSQS